MCTPLPPLTVAETAAAESLRGLIAALRAAAHCATPEADAAVIRARIEGLADARSTELLDLYQRATARQQGAAS